jgi:hypothetical protein
MPLEVRRDEIYLGNCRRAWAAIVLGMPAVLAAWASLGVKLLPMLLWLVYSAILGHVAFVRPLAAYRCPQCGRPLPPSEEARPQIRFRCDACGVEWDVERTGE